MRFLRKDNSSKTILVISDLHLGAGAYVDGEYNYLEDFHHDQELVDFLKYYSSGEYLNKDVELIINGDFLDFLAVPFVRYFDDEFWSEAAAVDKCAMMIKAHREVCEELNNFLSKKNKKIIYIIGNHDAELVLPKVQEKFITIFSEETKKNFSFYSTEDEYIPIEGVVIKHGHQYERAHDFDLTNSVIKSAKGEKYFLPPWGSYYVMRVINKFKEERNYINQIRPIKTLLINGLIFDTLFTLRFMFANAFYFLMVRFLYIFKLRGKLSELFEMTLQELELFHDDEHMAQDFFEKHPKAQALIVGHTHSPIFKNYPDGKYFINTGTWTRMFNLDFARRQEGYKLTFAQIDKVKDDQLTFALNTWKGVRELPYEEF